ncbi:hypothetical protein ACU4GD_00075 [Cupriavidus basilensis]
MLELLSRRSLEALELCWRKLDRVDAMPMAARIGKCCALSRGELAEQTRRGDGRTSASAR